MIGRTLSQLYYVTVYLACAGLALIITPFPMQGLCYRISLVGGEMEGERKG